MIRLPTLNARKLLQALKRAGFEEIRQRGSHLLLWHSEKRREICVPIHGKDLGRNLVRAILREADLTEEEFWKLL